VIPILIDNARMPEEVKLPSSLAQFAYRNAVEIDQGRDFHSHVDRLIRGMELQLRKSSSPMTDSLGMRLVCIEAGEFLMGSPVDRVDQLMQLFPDILPEGFRNAFNN
jgi:hypothetical protein